MIKLFVLLTISIISQNQIFEKKTFSNDTVKIVFLGDIMQHSPQLKSAHIVGTDTLNNDSYQYKSYFKYTDSIIKGADFAVANMEFVVGVTPFSGYPTFSAPLSLPIEAKRAGIDLFLCANNHICDKGKRGIVSTLESYKTINAEYTGLYYDIIDKEKSDPYIVNLKGIKVAFINITYGTNGIPVSPPYIVNKLDTLQIKKSIERANTKSADIIIALPHWGVEYSLQESEIQRDYRDFFIKNGVNIVVGTHPHVLQPVTIEKKDGIIKNVTAYSLGNFISNMSMTNTQMGSIFSITLIKKLNCAVVIDSVGEDWVWCARKGEIEGGYTTIPVEIFKDKKGVFKREFEYNKMMKTYNLLKSIFNKDVK